ncbi:hypothetical protein [Trinickia fusca]|nr:hypothetical protein [Trinickia fusca]
MPTGLFVNVIFNRILILVDALNATGGAMTIPFSLGRALDADR